MKHTLKVTSILLLMFLFSQLIGLAVVNKYINAEESKPSGEITAETTSISAKENVTWNALPFSFERPQVEEGTSFIYLAIAIGIGTLLALLLIKFRSIMLWKVWFFLSVWLTMGIAFAAFIPQIYAAALALALAILKVFRSSFFFHNFTELFVYAGIAAIIVPIANLFSAFMLLIAISIYDIYAVWKSKHMVKLAQFQTGAGLFAGFAIPYRMVKGKTQLIKQGIVSRKTAKSSGIKSGSKSKTGTKNRKSKEGKTEQGKTAILGGGDIAFPMIFAGVVMKSVGLMWAAVIPIFVTISLAFLFWRAEKNKFYPAMPFLSAGCIVGFLAVIVMRLIF